MGLYFRGEPDEADRWFAESAALAPASAQWLAGEASLAYRSWIAGERGRLDEQRVLAETAAEFVRDHGTEKSSSARLRWRWEYRSQRAAGPGRHCR